MQFWSLRHASVIQISPLFLHDPILFHIEFDRDCAYTFTENIIAFTSFVEDESDDSSVEVESTQDFAASIDHIENSQKIYLPLYLDLLQ